MRPLRPLGDDAVSPVIGIILMVAITVILTTVVGTFVLDLGSSGTEPAPFVNWDFEAEPNGTDFSGNGDTITVSHRQGDELTESLAVLVDGERVDSSSDLKYVPSSGFGSSVGPGDSVTVKETTDGAIEEGDPVLVVYRPDRPKLRTVMDQGTVE
jgi:FlaG/FlaF family flagellin (archaellin)